MAISSNNKNSVEELLTQKNFISSEQLEKAKNILAQTHEKLEDVIVRLGFVTEKQILDIWAEMLSSQVVDLTNMKIDAKLLSLIPEANAKQYKMIPYRLDGKKLTIVMADPFDILAKDYIAFMTQCDIEVFLAPKSQIELAIRQLYSSDDFSGDESIKSQEDEISKLDDMDKKASEQGAVVRFLDAVFKQAILKRASDIHVEPREESVLVRFRIDGILHDAMVGPKNLLAPLISRIKILSHLDIAERRLPQDGRLKVKMQDNEVDFRVSTVPSLLGEKAVLRLLQREAKYDLDNIGFFPDDLTRLKSALDEPYGLILVTGPTGAGKTTTLFGMLKYFSNSEINIFTIENPVEYRISGITQVQINEKIGLDFATGLRAALRQDPDVILVGEIRDLETADIAFRASLTGHKVLSTIHTNNAPATINRLINMGVPPYLVTAAVRVVISQKLLHKNCPFCSTEYRPSQNIIQRLGISPAKIIGTKFYKGQGCKECNNTGIHGRLGVYEVMVVTNSIKNVIMEGGTEGAIKRVARLEGMRTMREAALELALKGQSTLEEVIYVTPSDDEEKSISIPGLSGIGSASSVNNFILPVQMGQSVGIQRENSPMQYQQPQTAGQTMQQPGIDLNDPVIKTIIAAIEKDFLFLNDEKLAEKLHIPVLQIKELMQAQNLERNEENFEQHFGNNAENFSESDVSEIIQMINEQGGEIPAFVLANEKMGPLWAAQAVKAAIEKYRNRFNKPEDLPVCFTDDFILESGLTQVFEWAQQSRFKLIELAMPGKYKPWEFGETQKWLENNDLKTCAREAVTWLMNEKLQCSRGDLPTMLNKQCFKDNGLEALLEQFDDSCFRIVDQIFPGIFKQWQFVEEEALLWFRENRLEIAAEATKWLIEDRLGIPYEDIPKRISIREFHMNGLSKLLDLFNQNLFHVIDNAYKGQFKPWQFSEQSDIWKSSDALEIARQATQWLITEKLHISNEKAITYLTRRHFISNGLGQMLGSLFNHSPFNALENLMPELKTNEAFQKILFAYSHDIREITAKWETLAEKIAIMQFGKARFKVTLPNLKIASIVPENERIYINASNQIEYVPQIIIPRLNAHSDLSDLSNWVPYCDRLIYWMLGDDRGTGYTEPTHPKVKLVFAEALIPGLRSKGLLDIVEKLQQLAAAHNRLLDVKAEI